MFSWFLNWLADVGPVGGGDTYTSPQTQPSSPVEETLGRGMSEYGGNSPAGVAGMMDGGSALVGRPRWATPVTWTRRRTAHTDTEWEPPFEQICRLVPGV